MQISKCWQKTRETLHRRAFKKINRESKHGTFVNLRESYVERYVNFLIEILLIVAGTSLSCGNSKLHTMTTPAQYTA